MRILITGADGMLGTDLGAQLSQHDLVLADRGALDITNATAVRRAVAGCDVVINAAAYTSVDAAEAHEDEAYRVNADGPRYLAEAAKTGGARLVHVSTDYVFDGASPVPYAEDSPHHPLSAYGRTKAAGERFVRSIYPEGSILIRTAWLYGRNGRNFGSTILALAETNETVDVVTDQRGQPTWTADLARHIRLLLDREGSPGIYHGTNSGAASWYDVAQLLFAECGLDSARIRPTDSAHFERPARRPKNSVLAHDAWRATGLSPMRPWQDALRDAVRTGVFAQNGQARQPDTTHLG